MSAPVPSAAYAVYARTDAPCHGRPSGAAALGRPALSVRLKEVVQNGRSAHPAHAVLHTKGRTLFGILSLPMMGGCFPRNLSHWAHQWSGFRIQFRCREQVRGAPQTPG